MSKFFKSKQFYLIIFCTFLLVTIVFFLSNLGGSYAQIQENVLIDRGNVEEQVRFLSDIPYSKAQVGWGNVSLDKTQSNTPLTLVLNGSSTVFKKGIWAHATSTVEYDISEYKDYAYFSTYYGVNTTAQNVGNGVKFYVYTSKDGKEWKLETEENPPVMKSPNNAGYIKIDIKEVNYIRLYANDNGSNASDHAVWADTKLTKKEYTENVMIPVEEFDSVIKARYTSGAVKDDLKLTLLQRNFIARVGQYQLRSFLEADPKNRETLEWFIYNEEALRLWTVGGIPNGSYQNALQVLSNLYHAHKEDLANENVTESGTKYKDLYLRMMLSLSLTHSSNIGLWIGGNQLSDAVTRYEIYKDMHLNNQLSSSSMFERLTVEEMRWLMHVNIDDEEIKWLHDYSEKRYSNLTDRFNPFKYIKYTLSYSYYRPQYYSQENYDKWDQKYNLSKYNITYQSGKPKLWIVFEEGAVCGGLSKTAANLYGVWGIPASVVGQPGHAAYIYYYEVGGKGAWQLAYNVVDAGWANTQGYSRMPNDWGNLGSGVVTSTGSIKSASYFFLAQEAQNEYEKYEEAEFIMLLANVYKNDRAKLERIYRDTLKEENIHWEAWLGLVNLYITDESKSQADLISLAEEISEVLTYHPLPMYDLTRRIGTKITSPEYKGRLMMLQEQTLRKAKKATGTNTIQYKEVPIVAQALLGEINSEIATFSFNGANAGKITLSKQLQSTQVTWSYSLDGGQTWKDCYEHSVQLTDQEIASITIDNDIKVHISGLDYSESNIYTIDITKRAFPGGVVTASDEEDRLFGVTNEMEWTLDPNGDWNSFANTNPIFNGNKRVYVRIIAAGTQIASDPVYFTFTENNSDDTKWYIQSKNLSVVEVNATQTGDKNNIIDGNINTYWRSKNNVMPAYVTIKLNEPRYISALDYVPDKSALYLGGIPYGRAQNVNIYVSMDNQNWELAASKNNLADNNSLKHIDLPEPKKALYVKFECTKARSGPISSLTVSVIKLYENVLVNETPRAEINYNIINPTNKDVVAELINPTRPITVTNNDGKTSYTFTQNGDFTFEFVDADGNKGSTTAHVDWIDKEPPQASVEFSTTDPTNEDVVATITFNKQVTILSKDVEIVENPVDKSQTITFLNNATYELKFEDTLGNIGTKTIKVDWIDKENPTAEFEYSTIHLTDKAVTAKLSPSEPVAILNNDGKDTYTFNDNGSFTFEFEDRAGNKGTATATVSWIGKLPKYEIKYSIMNPTNQNVDATVELESGYRIVNNDAKNVYTFVENGIFSFQYTDNKGNVGLIQVSVNWIDKVAPTAELKYVKEKDKVVVSVINPSEEITFKEGTGTYEFTQNGKYDIIFYDKVGNEGKLTAIIDSIKDDTEDNTPDKPNKPGEENKPGTNPPNIPDKPGPSNKPSPSNKPEVSNKPSTSNKPNSSSKPNASSKPDITTPTPTTPNKPEVSDKPNDDIQYKKYTSLDVSVEIPTGAITEEGILKAEKFELSKELKEKFGETSRCYDIYLSNRNSKKIDINTNELIKIRISLNDKEKFIGVYEITSDNTAKPVNYTKNGNSIEVKANKLGKYVVSYQDTTTTTPPSNGSTDTNQKDSYTFWIIIGCISVLIVLYIYMLSKKHSRRRTIENE